jgi:hypothetical protein
MNINEYRRLNSHQFPLDPASDDSVVFGGDHVHLAANPELGQVDAWLDREAGKGKNAPLIVRLEIVEVCSTAVELRANIMAGTMREVLPVTGVANDGARRIVRFES